jgi:hypothetical protein
MALAPFTDMEVGNVAVHTTVDRGHSAEEIAEMALDKIVQVSESAPPPIRDQALAYQENLRSILQFYIRQAMLSERTTMRAEIAASMKEIG